MALDGGGEHQAGDGIAVSEQRLDEGAAGGDCAVRLSPAALDRMAESRAQIEMILAAGETVYGVNTGFGKLADVRIAPEHLAQLQTNLVRSHAGGLGEPLSIAEARAMVLEAKEGLALLNGTQAMTAVGGLAVVRSGAFDGWCV